MTAHEISTKVSELRSNLGTLACELSMAARSENHPGVIDVELPTKIDKALKELIRFLATEHNSQR